MPNEGHQNTTTSRRRQGLLPYKFVIRAMAAPVRAPGHSSLGAGARYGEIPPTPSQRWLSLQGRWPVEHDSDRLRRGLIRYGDIEEELPAVACHVVLRAESRDDVGPVQQLRREQRHRGSDVECRVSADGSRHD